MSPEFSTFQAISDQDLLREVTRLAAREREATACLIASLTELDARRLYLAEGFSSLFTYCVQVLHLSEHAAYDRIEVARAVRRFPTILAQLTTGAVTLTTARLLAPHLTNANHVALLAEARHRSRREVEQIVARLHPQPDVASTVRKLPAATARLRDTPVADGPSNNQERPETPETPRSARPTTSGAAPPPVAPAPDRPAVIAPLAPARYKVSFTISAETYAKLQEAQALLRHVNPTGNPALIFDRALTLLLADCARKRYATTATPKQHRPSTDVGPPATASPLNPVQGDPEPVERATRRGTTPRSRYIPAEVKRTVWDRDGGSAVS